MTDEKRIVAKQMREQQVKRQKLIIMVLAVCLVISAFIYIVTSCGKGEDSDSIETSSMKSEDKVMTAKTTETLEERVERVRKEAIDADYPEGVIELLSKNPATVQFVDNYGEQKDCTPAKEITELRAGEIPQLLQWDARWGYAPYGTSIVAVSGCGPTCLSMVLSGLTGDKSLTPAKMAEYGTEHRYVTAENDTLWAFMSETSSAWGISCKQNMWGEDELKRELQAGHPIICSVGPGDFTKIGHFIVLAGYEDGKVIVHDPFNQENSDKRWEYEEFKDQIKSMWTYLK